MKQVAARRQAGSKTNPPVESRATFQQVRPFQGHAEGVSAVAISADNKWVVTGSLDRTVRLWDLETGKEVRKFAGHDSAITGVAITPDNKRLISSSGDGTIRVWETDTGKELCRLVSFRDGAWAVIDGDGRFDTSSDDNVAGLHWVIGNRIALSGNSASVANPRAARQASGSLSQ